MLTSEYFSVNMFPFVRLKGYRVYVRLKDTSLEESYFSNTRRDIWKDIHKALMKSFNNTMAFRIEQDRDSDCDRFIYFILEIDQKNVIKDIINVLDEFYKTDILPNLIPKLMTIICQQLERQKYFASAIMQHQKKHGFDRTDSVIYTYFHDIR